MAVPWLPVVNNEQKRNAVHKIVYFTMTASSDTGRQFNYYHLGFS